MKLSDIINKIVGLDASKDYDMTIAETQATPEEPSVPPTTPQGTQQNEQPGQNSSAVEQTGDSAKIAQLEAEIANLKKVNQSLLSRTPVEEENQTVESMIFNMVMPPKKGDN